MGTPEHRGGWARRWVAGALGGALLLGLLGARAVPPPPPLVRADHPRHAPRPREPEPPPPSDVAAEAGDEPGAGPGLIWLFPMAGQLSGAPNPGE